MRQDGKFFCSIPLFVIPIRFLILFVYYIAHFVMIAYITWTRTERWSWTKQLAWLLTSKYFAWTSILMVRRILEPSTSVFVVGVYAGNSKPMDIDADLEDVISDLRKAFTNGWKFPWNGTTYTVQLNAIICDTHTIDAWIVVYIWKGKWLSRIYTLIKGQMIVSMKGTRKNIM